MSFHPAVGISATFDAPRPRALCWATVVGMVVLRRRTTIQGAGAPKVAPTDRRIPLCLASKAGSVEDIAVSIGSRLTCTAADLRMHHHQERPIEGGHGIARTVTGIRQHRRPGAPDASGQSYPGLRAGPLPGTVQRHGHDESGVSMQAGEGADRLRLGTIDGKGLVATFREELRVRLAELQEASGDFELGEGVGGSDRWEGPVRASPRDAGNRRDDGCPDRPGSAPTVPRPGRCPARRER